MALLLILLSLAATVWCLLATDVGRADPVGGPPLPVGHPAGAGRITPPGPDDPLDTERCRVEKQLVAGLLNGTLSPSDYQAAMAVLAAVDAVRKPVTVPPEHTR